MKKEDNKSALANIAELKKDLLMMRIKASSGEAIVAKDYKNKKKEVARLFTKINNKKAAA
jgi:ribosomal protein L29